MSQCRIADSGIGYPHVGIKPGQDALVIKKIFAVVGTQDSPVGFVVDIIGLAAVDKGYVKSPIGQKVVSANRDGFLS